MSPARMNTLNLVAALRTIALHIEHGDSYEGSFEYHALPESDQFEVEAAYRVGNADGQGGMVLIRGREPQGTLPNASDERNTSPTYATEVGSRRHTRAMPGAE